MSETALTIPQATHLMPALTIGEAMTRYQTIVGYVQQAMTEGKDYGTVPGTNKPTLFKPGAEKLTTLFGLTPQFPIVEKVEDWSGTEYGGEAFFYYWYKCQLWRGDNLIAEADGSCNSRESKYRWRWVPAEDIPPGYKPSELKQRSGSRVEFGFAVDKAETSGKYAKSPEYWQEFKDAIASGKAKKFKKSTRAGKEYDAWEIDSTVYRVPNEDIYSQVNTVKKMAQKRALVAATLLAVNASEFFTQDLEDLDPAVIDASYTVVSKSDNDDSKSAGPDWSKVEGQDKSPPVEKKTNGNGDAITSPKDLRKAINDETGGYYNSIPHMLNSIRKVTGDKAWNWPQADDVGGFEVAFALLIEYAEANEAAAK